MSNPNACLDHQLEKDAREVLGILAGHASMCWEPRPNGIFDSTEACKAVDAAFSRLSVVITEAVNRATRKKVSVMPDTSMGPQGQ
jgi:hypothetical protein